jgi:hypothetical protein
VYPQMTVTAMIIAVVLSSDRDAFRNNNRASLTEVGF